MTNKITFLLLAAALLCMTGTAVANQVVFPHYHVWPYRQTNILPYYQARVCPYFQDHEWIDYQDYTWLYHQDHDWLYSRAYLWPYNRTLVRPVVVRPFLVNATLPCESSRFNTVLSLKSQQPQPVVLKNYYLASKDNKETLPFWQGPKPLRLQNQFLNEKKGPKKK